MFDPARSPDVGSAHAGHVGDAKTARLVHVKTLSHGERDTGNKIVQGDNLAAMLTLQADLEGKVRCAYLDPPYRNGERYTHYLDDLRHEEWIAQVVARIAAVRALLASEGSIWVSIDDTEVHYLKVALDRVFGRENFVTTIIWQQRTTRENRKVFSNNHEYVLVYAKDRKKFGASRQGLPFTDGVRARYDKDDGDGRGPWQSVSANVQAGHAVASQFYTITAPNGTKHVPPNGRCWVYNKDKMLREIAEGNISFGRDGGGVPRIKKFLSRTEGKGLTPETLWLADDVGTNDQAKKHLHTLFPGEQLFDTPKPEGLIERILSIATLPGDLVLDPYLGSGTTGAVALKTGRRFVGIESGDHAASIAAARVKAVVKGEAGGISGAYGWTGGSGFDFYRLK